MQCLLPLVVLFVTYTSELFSMHPIYFPSDENVCMNLDLGDSFKYCHGVASFEMFLTHFSTWLKKQQQKLLLILFIINSTARIFFNVAWIGVN